MSHVLKACLRRIMQIHLSLFLFCLGWGSENIEILLDMFGGRGSQLNWTNFGGGGGGHFHVFMFLCFLRSRYRMRIFVWAIQKILAFFFLGGGGGME